MSKPREDHLITDKNGMLCRACGGRAPLFPASIEELNIRAVLFRQQHAKCAAPDKDEEKNK